MKTKYEQFRAEMAYHLAVGYMLQEIERSIIVDDPFGEDLYLLQTVRDAKHAAEEREK